MSGIRSTVGLISGIDIGNLVDALIKAERAPVVRMESRVKNLQAQQTAYSQLQAQLLALSSAVQKLSNRSLYSNMSVTNSDPQRLTVTPRGEALAGNYQFQPVRLAQNHVLTTRGFSSPDTQAIGHSGALRIVTGGWLQPRTKLDLLRTGEGISPGKIRIQDRSGQVTDVDLSNAVTIQDVVQLINQAQSGVRATILADRLMLQDITGQTNAALAVSDLGGGQTAAQLGIAQSVTTNTLTGDSIFSLTEDFTYALLNDGNGLRQLTGQNDLAVNLSDGTVLDINLDDTQTLGDFLRVVNQHPENGGKLTATLLHGRLVLTDHTSGTHSFSISNWAGSNAREFFGLDRPASGNVLTGRLLHGGLDSVLLRNLRGGQGIRELGSIHLTDRTGQTATIDLSSAETLDDVLVAINSAGLLLRAERDDTGLGIRLRDTSGSSSHHLVVSDVGSGTVAADLGLTVDAAVNEVRSGPLGLRFIHEATALTEYTLRGTFTPGSFLLEDTNGQQAVVTLSSSVRTVGDVLDRINAAGIGVVARLNATGDGIELVDTAGGSGTLQVTEIGGRTATDLRILGTGVVGPSGHPTISGRVTREVQIAASDTLNLVVSKINNLGMPIRASIVETGSTLSGYRLVLAHQQTGAASRFYVDEQLGLNFGVQQEASDAVLRVGQGSGSTLRTSANNTFVRAAAGLDVTLLATSQSPAQVNVARNTAAITDAVRGFVDAYNSWLDKFAELTRYDAQGKNSGPLQGNPTAQLIQQRMQSVLIRTFGAGSNTLRTLRELGIQIGANGKLTLQTSKLDEALRNAPEEVQALLSQSGIGFAPLFQQTLDSFTNTTTGVLNLRNESLQTTIDSLNRRITQLDEVLGIRRARLERQFIQMETALSGLQGQQTALNNLAQYIASTKSAK